MQELIQKIQSAAGITEQQAQVAANTAKDFIKNKVPPMFVGMVDQFFAGTFNPADAMKAAQGQQADFMDKAKDAVKDAGDKMQDFTKDAIDKSAEFAKQATQHMHDWVEKAGGWSEDALAKFKGMFGGEGQQQGQGQQSGGQK